MSDSTISMLLRLDSAGAAMGVRQHEYCDRFVSFEQNIIPALADPSGRPGVPMFGALLDSALGSAAYRSGDTAPLTVLAGMSVALTGARANSALIIAEGSSVHIDPETGTALGRAEVRDSSGVVFASATARVARVDREFIDEVPDRLPAALPIDSAVGAPHIYGLTIAHTGTEHVTARVEPQTWMLNPLGSIQGGVIAGLMAVGTELTARTLAASDRDFYLSDISVDFLRSPTLSMGVLTLECTLVRRGRRFCLLDAALRTDEGVDLVRSHATVLLA